jgi:hypothetical protein
MTLEQSIEITWDEAVFFYLATIAALVALVVSCGLAWLARWAWGLSVRKHTRRGPGRRR